MELLTVKQVAEMLNTKPANVYHMCNERKVEHVRIPGVGIRIEKADVLTLIKSQTVKKTA